MQEIKLIGVTPPIEKMEGPFHLLTNLEHFSLSTNQISAIANLQSFKVKKIFLTPLVVDVVVATAGLVAATVAVAATP